MQFVMDSIAPPPAGETPQAALVRRGAHLASAPEGHSLRRAVPQWEVPDSRYGDFSSPASSSS